MERAPNRFATVLLLLIAGCAQHSFYEFMPTPNLYLRGEGDPFDQVPPDLRTPFAEIIYFTDRVPGKVSARGQEYGFERNRSAAFGTMRVNFGKDLTWDQLIVESRSAVRSKGMNVNCSDIHEIGRYPGTPEPLDFGDPNLPPTAETIVARTAADEAFDGLLRSKLAQSTEKDVYLFVHGYHCEFEWPAYVIGQLWHFMGRQGVAVAYSWPAARPGLLRGYQYDRESGEFTVFHLKRFLKRVAACPDVERVHILSHSRGTDVATTALRELMFTYGSPREARKQLKLGTLILAAADIDAEVSSQRLGAERVIELPERVTLYVSSADKALGTSTWLFGSNRRIGMLRPEDLRGGALKILQQFPQFEVVDSRVKTPKIFSHSYFFAHPAGNSDMILLLRDGRRAGDEHGRPLARDPSGFWILQDDYLKLKSK